MFVFLICLSSCQLERSNYNAKYLPYTTNFYEITGYDLLQPTETFILPETLTEISGLALLNDSTVACVEDESGVIFLYSLTKGKMIDQLRFEGPGDYEGIEVIGDRVFVLKSNGNLYEYSIEGDSTTTIKTPLKGSNNTEGLTYDQANNRLLIVCKGRAGIGDKKLSGKAIYSYNLSTGFDPNPVFVITPEDLERWNQKQTLPINLTKRKAAFMPSAIGIHPISGNIYLLATVGKLLIVLKPSGEIKYCVPLSPRVLRQPEGICFTSSGDLIISNEGQEGSGKIQYFKRAEGLKDLPSED
jgi:uncharacterized protein YjiK